MKLSNTAKLDKSKNNITSSSSAWSEFSDFIRTLKSVIKIRINVFCLTSGKRSLFYSLLRGLEFNGVMNRRVVGARLASIFFGYFLAYL